MKRINWNEASTKRGLIWLITAAVGSFFLYQGKPIDELVLLASAIAGGLGLLVDK